MGLVCRNDTRHDEQDTTFGPCEHMDELPWEARSYITYLSGNGLRYDVTVYDKECPVCSRFLKKAEHSPLNPTPFVINDLV